MAPLTATKSLPKLLNQIDEILYREVEEINVLADKDDEELDR
jgi:hypothetical protein